MPGLDDLRPLGDTLALVLLGVLVFVLSRTRPRIAPAPQSVRAGPGLAARLSGAGRTAEALAESRRLLAALPLDVCDWTALNDVVCTMITAGRYREALAARRRWPRSELARATGDEGQALTYLNLVEALYNLGKLAAAERLLTRIEASCRPHDLARNGHRVQQAWLATLRGRPGEALALLDEIEPGTIPADYQPEIHYTRAAALRDTGAYAAAVMEAERGLVAAVRAPSKRNGLFLLGTIAQARGDWNGAIRQFERGVVHAYQGQGGDALAALAACYQRTGHVERLARTHWLLLERDPECGHARQLRRQLKRRPEPVGAIA